MSESPSPVIVIGAGIAGLNAAWQLSESGVQVFVLEADAIVGGRMRSLELNNALIDYGAQFFSSAYSIIPVCILFYWCNCSTRLYLMERRIA